MRFVIIGFFILSLSEVAMAHVSIVSVPQALASWKQLQIVDARSLQEYRSGHLPGAVHMDWREYRQHPSSLRERLFGVSDGPVLGDPILIGERLTSLGLREDLPILVYGGESRWGEEGRIAWNLLYWGAVSVQLLDGGWQSWVAHAPKVSAVIHPKKTFAVGLRQERRSDFARVKDAIAAKELIVDVRTKTEVENGMIPTARHFLDAKLYRSDGTYPSRQELEAILPELGTATTFYCAGGVRSALAALLVEARFGRATRNYDGSMWDWQKKIIR